MPARNEIESDKILLKQVFELWFRIPEYQRPYVWGYEQIHDLLDDLTFAVTTKPDSQYFLGSLVFQFKPADKEAGRPFDEHDLLDGQQRLTTILLVLAVLRDLASDDDIRRACQRCIFQEAERFLLIPERVRLDFDTRPRVKQFVERFVKQDGGTSAEDALDAIAAQSKDLSVTNMAAAIRIVRDYLREKATPFAPLLQFLLNNVLLIYVSTRDLDDAFRLFTILNDRGIPLRNSDILKSMNLGALDDGTNKSAYARMWEEAEGELGDDFDRFLAYVRTILVKEKARLSLLREYEDVIYAPKEKDRVTQQLKPVLLRKGKQTFDLVQRYFEHYRQLFGGNNHEVTGDYAFDNLIKVMRTGLPSTDWVPPLLRYFDKFSGRGIFQFTQALNRKFTADWLCQRSPTDRIEAMNALIRLIDRQDSAETLLAGPELDSDFESALSAVDGKVYGRRFALHVLLMLDYSYQNQQQRMHTSSLSIEHILPQTPSDESQWRRDFTDAERETWTDRLGNLVLITGRKNSSQGNLDYVEKKQKYFKRNIDTCPNSLRVLHSNNVWTLREVLANQETVIGELRKCFGMANAQPASTHSSSPVTLV